MIKNRSWILTIHKDRIFRKNLLENKEIVFKNGVKNIQAASYNDTRMVFVLICFVFCFQLIKTSSYWSKNTLNNKSSWKKNQNKYSTFKLRQNQIYCWDTKDIYCFNAEIPTRLHKWFEPIVKAWSKHPLNRAETKSSSYLLLVIAVIF